MKVVKLIETIEAIRPFFENSGHIKLLKSNGLNPKKDEYQGREVMLEVPFRADGGDSKFEVYVKNEKGNVIKLGFGSPDMEIKRDDPDNLKNFRSRFRCDTEKAEKWEARFWSCLFWEDGVTVSQLLGE